MARTDLGSLRESAERVLRLPDAAQRVVDAYLHIRVGEAVAACPYHINPGLRSTNRALLGKGRPAEIEAAARIWFKRHALDPGSDAERLREALESCGIGVDCSGFASWVMDAYTKSVLGRPLWKCLKFSGLKRRAVSKLRPVENISANLLTNQRNTRTIEDLSQIKPGDLIRSGGGRHVVIITEVGLDSAGRAHYFQYAQSSCLYGSESGVRTGHMIITDASAPLVEQQWFDNFRNGGVKESIASGGADSRVVRLKSFGSKSST